MTVPPLVERVAVPDDLMRPDVPVAPIRAGKDEHANVAIEEPLPNPESVLHETVAVHKAIAMPETVAIDKAPVTIESLPPIELPVPAEFAAITAAEFSAITATEFSAVAA
jgi:hypothetical protein